MITTHPPRPALGVMYAGLALTVAALAVPYVDHATANVLASHLHEGYPSYTPARIDSAVTSYLIYLSVAGVLGITCWLALIRAVQTRQRWARAAATVAFALGTAIALTNLLIRDTSGDTGLPPLLGWAGMLPCLAGLVAVTLLGKERHELSR